MFKYHYYCTRPNRTTTITTKNCANKIILKKNAISKRFQLAFTERQ